MSMHVTQVVNGRFHHFHLARQLETHGLLEKIYTGYPAFKLKDENGIPPEKIKTFPWLQTPYLWAKRFGLGNHKSLEQNWTLLAKKSLDAHAARRLRKPTVLVGLSSSALKSGRRARELGGRFVCDRGSSHIRYQDQVLREEYKRWGIPFRGVDPRMIDREEAEYEAADIVTVPSTFCVRSYLLQGFTQQKIVRIPYGVRLERFKKCGDPDPDKFTVLWVGAVSVRKAFMDALHAFQKVKHASKRFIVVGGVEGSLRPLLDKEDLSGIEFRNSVPNHNLPLLYSQADVFLLPSMEDGFAMVIGEALACGCPVIVSENTGGADLFTHGQEGFVVPVRSPDAISDHLQNLAEDRSLREGMSRAAMERVQSIGGWASYGNDWKDLIARLQ